MAFEQRFKRVSVKEKKKEFFENGHLSDFGIDEWIYTDVSWNDRKKNHVGGKEHLATCTKCAERTETRRLKDQGGRSRAVPVGDRD